MSRYKGGVPPIALAWDPLENPAKNLRPKPLYFPDIHTHIAINREIIHPGTASLRGADLDQRFVPLEGGAGNGETL